jgi:hypothetical protein
MEQNDEVLKWAMYLFTKLPNDNLNTMGVTKNFLTSSFYFHHMCVQ